MTASRQAIAKGGLVMKRWIHASTWKGIVPVSTIYENSNLSRDQARKLSNYFYEQNYDSGFSTLKEFVQYFDFDEEYKDAFGEDDYATGLEDRKKEPVKLTKFDRLAAEQLSYFESLRECVSNLDDPHFRVVENSEDKVYVDRIINIHNNDLYTTGYVTAFYDYRMVEEDGHCWFDSLEGMKSFTNMSREQVANFDKRVDKLLTVYPDNLFSVYSRDIRRGTKFQSCFGYRIDHNNELIIENRRENVPASYRNGLLRPEGFYLVDQATFETLGRH